MKHLVVAITLLLSSMSPLMAQQAGYNPAGSLVLTKHHVQRHHAHKHGKHKAPKHTRQT